MNKNDLMAAVSSSAGLSKQDSSKTVEIILDTITNALKRGEEVRLVGFGTFTKTRRAARTGVNPATGEKIKIKAKTLPKFRPGKAWKDMF